MELKLEYWTHQRDGRFDRFMGKMTSENGLRYENIPVRVIPETSDVPVCPPDTVVLILGRRLHERMMPGDTLDHLRGSVWEHPTVPRSYKIFTFSPLDKTLSGDRIQALFNADMSKMAIWWKDCQKAIRIARKGYARPEERFIIEPSMEQIRAYCHERIAAKDLLAVDLETIGWKDTVKPFLFGVAHNESEGLCIPLLGQHRKEIWSRAELSEIKTMIEQMLTACPHVYQNALFDVKVLRQNNYRFPLEQVKHDTMLLHHTLDSALPHGLDFITSVYGDTPYWKDTLKKAPEKLSELSLEESSVYNLRDCVVLHQILPAMLQELSDEGLEDIYYNRAVAGGPGAMEQMGTGIYLSHKAIETWRTSIDQRINDLRGQLEELWPIKEHKLNLKSSDHLAWLIANQPLQKFEELEGLQDYEESPKQACRCSDCNKKYWTEQGAFPPVCTKCGSQTFFHLEEHKVAAKKKKLNNQGKVSKTYQNLLDLKALSEIPKFYNGRFKIKTSSKTKKYITDVQARQKLRLEAQKLSEQPRYKKHGTARDKVLVMIKWLELYDQWAHAEKQRSTYTTFPTWAYGKIHYNIMLHGTETGRPAARDIKILNQPTKNEPLLGACYVAPRGWKIVSMD